jgi:hypothetical protein
MMRDFIYWVHTNLPGIPAYAAMVGIFLLVSLALYAWTRSKGYLVTFFTGVLYLVPWFLHYATK